MINLSLRDYSVAYIGTVSTPNIAAAGATANNANGKVIFNNNAPCTNCISEINNTKVDHAHDIDVVRLCIIQ